MEDPTEVMKREKDRGDWMTKPELVNNPAHYGGKDDPFEHVKVALAKGWVENAFIYNATRYLWRVGRKAENPPILDLQKAVWYINAEIERLTIAREKALGRR